MAKNTGTEEVSEREYQTTLNAAVAATEDEVFTDALGSEELDNDGDTSLEEMGDGLEGDAEEGDEADEESEAEGESDAEAEGEEENAETQAAEGQEQEPARDGSGRFQRQDDRGGIPSARLREEADARRAAEARAQTLERQLAELNGRVTEISARANAQPKQPEAQAPPKPDMFAEPEKYEAWLVAEAERKAEAKLEQRFANYERQQQERESERVNQNLADAARGDRAFEFGAAYNALTSLDRNNPQAITTVRKIYNSPDPASALFDWWDKEGGGPDYRERILAQLMPRQRQGQPQRGNGQQQQPRHEIRPGQRLPSLNAATGSNVQQTGDPEMLDGSEASVFRFGAAR